MLTMIFVRSVEKSHGSLLLFCLMTGVPPREGTAAWMEPLHRGIALSSNSWKLAIRGRIITIWHIRFWFLPGFHPRLAFCLPTMPRVEMLGSFTSLEARLLFSKLIGEGLGEEVVAGIIMSPPW
jgi:hypothetical protein